jgi:hypothetical protein
MNAEHFEERLMLELKSYVEERSDRPAGRRASRRATPRLQSHWRLATGGIGVGVAAVVGVAVALATGSPAAQTAQTAQTGQTATPGGTVTGPLFHTANAAYAIDEQRSGAVDITILDASGQPDIDALRSDLAKAGVDARVMANVPTCDALAKIPGAPSPVGSAQARIVTDPLDYPFSRNGDFAFSVDASARTHGTTLTIMFSGDLSTISVERTSDSGPLPNCLPDATGN